MNLFFGDAGRLGVLDDNRVVGRQRGDSAHGGPEGKQGGAEDAGGERDVEDRTPLPVLDDDAPNGALAYDLFQLRLEVGAADLELFGAWAGVGHGAGRERE